jgi:uncharacterized protein (TIGR03905 family)
MVYKTSGTCSSEIDFEIDEKNETIKSVKFINGCSGNTSGISRLVAGMPVDEVIKKLEGIPCGFKSTSCPDQLAKALKKWRAAK